MSRKPASESPSTGDPAVDLFIPSVTPPENPVSGASFEVILERLEEIVRQLETGGKGLDDSLALYKEGMLSVADLTERLSIVRETVLKLTRATDGALSLTPFDEDDQS